MFIMLHVYLLYMFSSDLQSKEAAISTDSFNF